MKEYLAFNSKSLFKFILLCSTGFYVPVALLMGVLAWLDIVPATLNEQQYTGFKGFVIYVAFIPVFVMILTLSHWVMLALGLKLVKVGMRITMVYSGQERVKYRLGSEPVKESLRFYTYTSM